MPGFEAILTGEMAEGRRVLGAFAGLLLAATAGAAAEVVLLEDGREPVRWTEWRAPQGEVVLLVWASWAPRAGDAVAGIDRIDAAAAEHGLQLVVLVVQEPVEDARSGLAAYRGRWLHDRHGALLKELRVIKVPSLVVVDRRGEVAARLEPTTEALASWGKGRS